MFEKLARDNAAKQEHDSRDENTYAKYKAWSGVCQDFFRDRISCPEIHIIKAILP